MICIPDQDFFIRFAYVVLSKYPSSFYVNFFFLKLLFPPLVPQLRGLRSPEMHTVEDRGSSKKVRGFLSKQKSST